METPCSPSPKFTSRELQKKIPGGCLKAWVKNKAKQELERETKQRVGSKGE